MKTCESQKEPRELPFHADQLDQLGKYGAILTLAEAGLGSLLHALRLPFKGALLSLNQVFLLTHALNAMPQSARFLPSSISAIGALGKSLAPAGKKLTPMLAITMQGLLYNLGTLLLGNNPLGRSIGAALASLWGWAQQILLYTLIFGDALLQALEKCSSFTSLSPSLLVTLLLTCIAAKAALAASIALYTPRLSSALFDKYLKTLSTFSNKKQKPESRKQKNFLQRALWLSCLDLCKPLFLLSLLLTALFFYFWDSSPDWLFWGVLRPLAFGFLSFFLLRTLPLDKLLRRLVG